jgi:hypothetical protein
MLVNMFHKFRASAELRSVFCVAKEKATRYCMINL